MEKEDRRGEDKRRDEGYDTRQEERQGEEMCLPTGF